MSKNKKRLYRILAAVILFAAASFIPQEGAVRFVRLAVFLCAFGLVGYDVLWRAVRNIAGGQVFDENFLMALATIGAFFVGEYPEGVAVMIFYQVGELFQSYAVDQSRKSISTLMDIRPDYANLVRGNFVEEVDPEEVCAGDIILVKPGEKIPLDGVILEGNTTLDTTALTGESLPRTAKTGDEIISGCVNLTGTLKVRVTKEFGESTVAKILDLVENASSRKAKAENFITKFAKYYTPIVVIAAVALALIPPVILGLTGSGFTDALFSQWIYRALMFLVVSCPCALVISIPLGFFGGIGGASKQGILIKGSNYMETLASAEVVVFDKTGTLTKGNFVVTKITPAADNIAEHELLHAAALAEHYSNHPISLSITKAWEEWQTTNTESEKTTSDTAAGKPKTAVSNSADLDTANLFDKGFPAPKDVEEIAGHGVKATVGGHTIFAGNARLMEREHIAYQEQQTAGSIVYIAIDHTFYGSIVISDEIKPDAQSAITALRKIGVKKQVMLTGDNRQTGEFVAKKLGLDEVYTELLPADKVDKVEHLFSEKSEKGSLAFVGDGINDAPVLARADVGIAMGGLGSDAAIEAADLVIMTDEPGKIATAIQISKKTLAIVKENIVFAIGIKLLVLVLSAFGISTMWEAVFADVGVCVIAILNSMRALKK